MSEASVTGPYLETLRWKAPTSPDNRLHRTVHISSTADSTVVQSSTNATSRYIKSTGTVDRITGTSHRCADTGAEQHSGNHEVSFAQARHVEELRCGASTEDAYRASTHLEASTPPPCEPLFHKDVLRSRSNASASSSSTAAAASRSPSERKSASDGTFETLRRRYDLRRSGGVDPPSPESLQWRAEPAGPGCLLALLGEQRRARQSRAMLSRVLLHGGPSEVAHGCDEGGVEDDSCFQEIPHMSPPQHAAQLESSHGTLSSLLIRMIQRHTQPLRGPAEASRQHRSPLRVSSQEGGRRRMEAPEERVTVTETPMGRGWARDLDGSLDHTGIRSHLDGLPDPMVVMAREPSAGLVRRAFAAWTLALPGIQLSWCPDCVRIQQDGMWIRNRDARIMSGWGLLSICGYRIG
ncbi:hypothetical protein CYMTET_51282 [Cymbomonas tetramitiformis]|uniref:Uncharacterized protein n=1 Tax=Cymbomonas tetramitiformis TaxID=36881 RepID=A0AAE0EST7_9CHLO|nr:hypothetical protein CYMTET_51282 [Cymbomonas tetramitiformis]